MNLPDVPEGTLLRLDGDDWSYGHGLIPGVRVDVVVVRIRDDLAHLHDDALWVQGHAPECGYQPDPRPPRLELLVKVDRLRQRGTRPHAERQSDGGGGPT